MERSRTEKLAKRIEDLEADITGMRESQSWQALVSATRLVTTLEDKLQALQAEIDADFDPTSTEEIVNNVLQLPDEVFAHHDLQRRVRRCL